MFNVIQILRTIMGLAELNAFVAWCKHAIECIEVLRGDKYVSSESMQGKDINQKRTIIEIVWECQKLFLSRYKRGL